MYVCVFVCGMYVCVCVTFVFEVYLMLCMVSYIVVVCMCGVVLVLSSSSCLAFEFGCINPHCSTTLTWGLCCRMLS